MPIFGDWRNRVFIRYRIFDYIVNYKLQKVKYIPFIIIFMFHFI